MKIRAHVTATVELTVSSDLWNGNTPSEQILREGGEMAIKQLNDKIERYARIVGKPKVEAVITAPEVRR